MFTPNRPTSAIVGLMLILAAVALAQIFTSSPLTAGEPKDGKVKELVKARMTALRDLVQLTEKDYGAGRVSLDRLQHAQRALLNAELELCESDKGRVAVIEKMLVLAKNQEQQAKARHMAGLGTASEVLMATVGRLDVEIELERARAKASAKPK